ncbi:hypothetical protein GALMADRAFT_137527 [Galerina marginata CBS 339.88]|uniref:Uncharacterized protein n=1 Tax=Galerina marginata (strain CBS 339.88) TaxID=685588 RepID=A0A067T5T6_GALM3|nr:hypothetical protein GALMADRAFT_137527 [Galerina marginata CBS 339.88]
MLITYSDTNQALGYAGDCLSDVPDFENGSEVDRSEFASQSGGLWKLPDQVSTTTNVVDLHSQPPPTTSWPFFSPSRSLAAPCVSPLRQSSPQFLRDQAFYEVAQTGAEWNRKTRGKALVEGDPRALSRLQQQQQQGSHTRRGLGGTSSATHGCSYGSGTRRLSRKSSTIIRSCCLLGATETTNIGLSSPCRNPNSIKQATHKSNSSLPPPTCLGPPRVQQQQQFASKWGDEHEQRHKLPLRIQRQGFAEYSVAAAAPLLGRDDEGGEHGGNGIAPSSPSSLDPSSRRSPAHNAVSSLAFATATTAQRSSLTLSFVLVNRQNQPPLQTPNTRPPHLT